MNWHLLSEALAFLNAGKADLSESIVERLQHARPPASVSVYVAPFCKFCPDVVRRLPPLPFTVDGLRMRIIDRVLFKDAAEENRVRSVPTVILDNQYHWTGGVRCLNYAKPLKTVTRQSSTRPRFNVSSPRVAHMIWPG